MGFSRDETIKGLFLFLASCQVSFFHLGGWKQMAPQKKVIHFAAFSSLVSFYLLLSDDLLVQQYWPLQVPLLLLQEQAWRASGAVHT